MCTWLEISGAAGLQTRVTCDPEQRWRWPVWPARGSLLSPSHCRLVTAAGWGGGAGDSPAPPHRGHTYLISDCRLTRQSGSGPPPLLCCLNPHDSIFLFSVSSKIQPGESEAMRDLDRRSNRQQTWRYEGSDRFRRASQGWVCPLHPH